MRRALRRDGRAGRGGRSAIERAAAAAERATVTAGAVPAVAALRAAAAPGAALDPRISARRTAVMREHGRRRLRVVVIGLAATACLVGAWFLLHTPLFSARSITVFGNVHETAAQVEAQAALADHPPLLDVDAGATATRIEQLPWVRTAAVHVSWPDGVQITVTEETPRFVVSAPGGGWDSLSSDGRARRVGRPPAGIAVVDRSAAAGRSRLPPLEQ